MRILLIGYGKMGKTIEQTALTKGHQIIGRLTHSNAQEQRFRVLNGLFGSEGVVPGQKYKIVVRAN